MSSNEDRCKNYYCGPLCGQFRCECATTRKYVGCEYPNGQESQSAIISRQSAEIERLNLILDFFEANKKLITEKMDSKDATIKRLVEALKNELKTSPCLLLESTKAAIEAAEKEGKI